jgi:hypothetical protein
MSAEDLGGGTIWSESLVRQTDGISAAILCLTPENVKSPWILFETGALMKALQGKLVIPLTYDFDPRELTHPLSFFNGFRLNEEGVRRLILTLRVLAAPEAATVDFASWWSKSRIALESIPHKVPASDFLRSVRESDYRRPEQFAEFSARESLMLQSRLDELSEGRISLYSQEIERIEIDLINFMKAIGLRQICAVDLTTDPALQLQRRTRRSTRKRFLDDGGSIKRILVVDDRLLLKRQFLTSLCTLIEAESADGIQIGLLFKRYLTARQLQDFILYEDFAVLVESVQADRGYTHGVSVTHFKRREVELFSDIFNTLWPRDSKPIALQLKDEFLRLGAAFSANRTPAKQFAVQVAALVDKFHGLK